MCKNKCFDKDEFISEHLRSLYYELADPVFPIFDCVDLDREERKVRKLREAIRKTHNWFALHSERIEK